MRKKTSEIRLNWPLQHGPWAHNLDHSARMLGYPIAIFPDSFAKIRLKEKGENAVMYGRPDGQDHVYICLDKNGTCKLLVE